MKHLALSLTQPWASLAILGEKQYETRGWPIKYRGRLWIHASKSFPGWAKELCYIQPFRSALLRGEEFGPQYLATGAIIGTVDVIACWQIHSGYQTLGLGEKELAFGAFDIGRYMIELSKPERLAVPIPAKGQLGLWDCSQYVEVKHGPE